MTCSSFSGKELRWIWERRFKKLETRSYDRY